MGQKWAQIPACYLYPKTKVLYMKVIISYELKLSHTSSPYIACQLKHQVLTLNNRPIMSCIFQMYVKCHFTEWAQNKPKFQCAACTKKKQNTKRCAVHMGIPPIDGWSWIQASNKQGMLCSKMAHFNDKWITGSCGFAFSASESIFKPSDFQSSPGFILSYCAPFWIGIASSIFDPILKFNRHTCLQGALGHWNHY